MSILFLCYLQLHIYDYRDANHSDFCGIIPIFKADFHITTSEVQIPLNNDFNMVPDKIKGVTPMHLISGSKIKDWFVDCIHVLEKTLL